MANIIIIITMRNLVVLVFLFLSCRPCLALDLSFNLQMRASPTADDEYCDAGFDAPAEFEGMHVVGFEPLHGSSAHHMILYWCPHVWANNNMSTGDNCLEHESTVPCGNFAYVWAQNGSPLYFPPHVGILIGKGGALSFGLQLHYGFPVPAGFVDTSGVRVIVSARQDVFWRTPHVVLLAPHRGFRLEPGKLEIVLSEGPYSEQFEAPLVLFAVRTHAHIRGSLSLPPPVCTILTYIC